MFYMGSLLYEANEEIDKLRAQVQTLTQDVSHWKHEAERFKEALTLAQQDFKRVTAQLFGASSQQRVPDTSALKLARLMKVVDDYMRQPGMSAYLNKEDWRADSDIRGQAVLEVLEEIERAEKAGTS